MLVSCGEVVRAGAGNLSPEFLGLRRERGAPCCACCAPSEFDLQYSIRNRFALHQYRTYKPFVGSAIACLIHLSRSTFWSSC